MRSQKFLESLIQENLFLSKNSLKKSSFNDLLKQIIGEDLATVPAPTDVNEVPPQVAQQTTTPSALPPEDAHITIELTRLAVAAFFVDVEAFKDSAEEKGDSGLVQDISHKIAEISRYKDEMPSEEDCQKIIPLVSSLVKIGNKSNIEVNLQDLTGKLNFASRPLLIQLIVKALLTPAADITKLDPFIGDKMKKIPEELNNLTNLDLSQEGNLTLALDSAKKIQDELSDMIAVNSTGDLSVDVS
jgi:hypothetical protein